MGTRVSRHTKIIHSQDGCHVQNCVDGVEADASGTQVFYRTLDGSKKGMKIRSGALKCTWKNDIPVISVSKDTIRIKGKGNSMIELTGDQDNLELGGFHMQTQCIEEIDGRKGYGLGIDTKLLNLATFEIEVQTDGNIILTGRKLKKSKEGCLRLTTSPSVSPRNVCVDALDDNRKVWIRIYYETPSLSAILSSESFPDFPCRYLHTDNNNNDNSNKSTTKIACKSQKEII